MKTRGTAAIIVTHDDRITHYCDRSRAHRRRRVVGLTVPGAEAQQQSDDDERHHDADAGDDDLADALEVGIEERVRVPLGQRTSDHRVDEPHRREDQPRRRLGDRRPDRGPVEEPVDDHDDGRDDVHDAVDPLQLAC